MATKIVNLRCTRTERATETFYSIQDAITSLDEFKDREMIGFLATLVDYLNYKADHTETAFGDANAEYRRGFIDGYIGAKKWSKFIECGVMTIKAKGYLVFVELPRPSLEVSDGKNEN